MNTQLAEDLGSDCGPHLLDVEYLLSRPVVDPGLYRGFCYGLGIVFLAALLVGWLV